MRKRKFEPFTLWSWQVQIWRREFLEAEGPRRELLREMIQAAAVLGLYGYTDIKFRVPRPKLSRFDQVLTTMLNTPPKPRIKKSV